ncbi:MAG: NAD(P)H-dependent glycerol-3-phosphate dehydrogenase [Candidatus Hydrogenedentales bacterium]
MNIQVVGAGSFGLALSRLLADNGLAVRIWCRKEDNPEQLRQTRENPTYLPGVKLPPSVEVTTDVDSDVEMAVLAVPSHVMRIITQRFKFSAKTIRVSVAKGIENDSLQTMSQVIRDTSGDVPVVALSGPSHAEEVGRRMPALVTAAADDVDLAETVQEVFLSDAFRVYTSSDIIGVELGGSLKNVIAIAAGVSDGYQYGDNARAALITRGLAEMARLGAAMDADPLTFAGLSGMGDLIATCTSSHSRNRTLGQRIAQGMTVTEALAVSPMVAEGYRTSRSAHMLALRHHVYMPITDQVYRVLYEGLDPRATVTSLMQREPKHERS